MWSWREPLSISILLFALNITAWVSFWLFELVLPFKILSSLWSKDLLLWITLIFHEILQYLAEQRILINSFRRLFFEGIVVVVMFYEASWWGRQWNSISYRVSNVCEVNWREDEASSRKRSLIQDYVSWDQLIYFRYALIVQLWSHFEKKNLSVAVVVVFMMKTKNVWFGWR